MEPPTPAPPESPESPLAPAPPPPPSSKPRSLLEIVLGPNAAVWEPWQRKPGMPALVLVRGLPGSGKTKLAQWLANRGYVHLEAGMYFTDGLGRYKYDNAKIHDAHRYCFACAVETMKKHKNLVVANTFVRLWELEQFVKLAKRLKYFVRIIELTAKGESRYKIPSRTKRNMRRFWEEINQERLEEIAKKEEERAGKTRRIRDTT